MKGLKRLGFLILIGFYFPVLIKYASAHEVYVLDSHAIQTDLNSSTNVFQSITSLNNLMLFILFLMTTFLALLSIYNFNKISFFTRINLNIDKFRNFAPLIIRVILGISCIYSAINTSLFGPELKLNEIGNTPVLQILLIICGVLFILGLFVRISTLILIFIYGLAVFQYHEYLITYVNYIGECIVLLLMGGEKYSIDNILWSIKNKYILKLKNFGYRYAFIILRLTFGISLLYAAVYIKFLHSSLSLDVIKTYSLTSFFPFDPAFIVLTAGCIESLIGILFILGVYLRSNVIFFLLFVTASLLFFGESVWPHFILYGIAIGIFLNGYNKIAIKKLNNNKNLIKKYK